MRQIKNCILSASMIGALVMMQPIETASLRAASWKEQLQKVWNARYSVTYPNWAPYALIGGLGTLALAAVIYRYVPVFNIKTAKVPMMQSTQEEHKKEQKPSTAAALEAKAKEEAEAKTEEEEKKLIEADPEEKKLVDALRKLDETMANVYVYLRNLQKNEPKNYISFTESFIQNGTPLNAACVLVWDSNKSKVAAFLQRKNITQLSEIFPIHEYFFENEIREEILPVFIAKTFVDPTNGRDKRAEYEFFQEYRELFLNQLTQEQWNLVKSESTVIDGALDSISKHENSLDPFFLSMQKKTTILKTIAAIKKIFKEKKINYAIPWLEAMEQKIETVAHSS